MQLSDHFTLEELVRSDTAIRLDLNNTPDENAIENLKILANGLEKVRSELNNKPMNITSGYRSLTLNRALKSKDSSWHVLGLAADFHSPSYGDIQSVMKKIVDSDIEYQQIIEEYKSWIHISFPPLDQKAKKEKLIINKSGVSYYS